MDIQVGISKVVSDLPPIKSALLNWVPPPGYDLEDPNAQHDWVAKVQVEKGCFWEDGFPLQSISAKQEGIYTFSWKWQKNTSKCGFQVYPCVIYIYMSYTYDIDHTFPEINSSHLKMDSWNTIISFWDGLFSGCHLSFRGCNILVLPSLPNIWQEGFWMTCLGWLWKTSDLWYFGDAKFSNEIRFGCWSLLSSLAKVELEVLQGSLNEVALDV